jgi:hypothetical protein
MSELALITELKKINGVSIPDNILELLKEYRLKCNIVGVNKLIKPTCPLPYFPNLEYSGCKALRVNHKLYTPCGNDIVSDGFCKTCVTNLGRKYGTLEDRRRCLPSEFVLENGEGPINYGNVMDKLLIGREEAIREAAKWGQEIPEEQFEVIKKKRGRKKKVDQVICSDEELNNEPPEKKRGRPTKMAVEMQEREPNEEIKGELFKSGNGEIILKGYDGKFYDLVSGSELA